ncbi:unnamed protein product, partial [Iphiclides podalirius]
MCGQVLMLITIYSTSSQPPPEAVAFKRMVEMWTKPPYARIMEQPRENYLTTCSTELMKCYDIIPLKTPVCAAAASNLVTKGTNKKMFLTICDMHYTNCKENRRLWSYLKDDDGDC